MLESFHSFVLLHVIYWVPILSKLCFKTKISETGGKNLSHPSILTDITHPDDWPLTAKVAGISTIPCDADLIATNVGESKLL